MTMTHLQVSLLPGASCSELTRRSGDAPCACDGIGRYAAIHLRDVLLTRSSSLLDEVTPRADLVVDYVDENELGCAGSRQVIPAA
jgi:hypothetical protein